MIMRHSTSSTTEEFYVHCRDDQAAAAVAGLTAGEGASLRPHHSPHPSQHWKVQCQASTCEARERLDTRAHSAHVCVAVRSGAVGGGTRI